MTNFEYYTTVENGDEQFTEAIKDLAYKGCTNIIKCSDILRFLQEEHMTSHTLTELERNKTEN